jgi:hypothetical protein
MNEELLNSLLTQTTRALTDVAGAQKEVSLILKANTDTLKDNNEILSDHRATLVETSKNLLEVSKHMKGVAIGQERLNADLAGFRADVTQRFNEIPQKSWGWLMSILERVGGVVAGAVVVYLIMKYVLASQQILP